MQHLVGPVGPHLARVVGLVPLVPHRAEDDQVRLRHVVGQARALAVGHARVHLDVVRAGAQLREEVVDERLAVGRLAQVGRAHEQTVAGLAQAGDVGEERLQRRLRVAPPVVEGPAVVVHPEREPARPEGLERVVEVAAPEEVRDQQHEQHHDAQARSQLAGTESEPSATAEQLVHGHGEEPERDAARPCEVGGVSALHALRDEPDAEERDDEEHAGAERRRLPTHAAHAEDEEQRGGGDQQEEPDRELGRAGEVGERPPHLEEVAAALQEPLELVGVGRDGEPPAAP